MNPKLLSLRLVLLVSATRANLLGIGKSRFSHLTHLTFLRHCRVVFVALSAVLLSGCLLKTATVSPRHFVLTPIPVDKSGPTSKDVPVEIGFVKMPAYLLRDSMVVRNGTGEIEYLENALWAERLDQSFQRALMADVRGSAPSDTIHFADSEGQRQSVRVFITVDQFDVDTNGRGTLVAKWRIGLSDGNESLTSGYTSLARTGASPRGNPAAIARTMSELTAEFSSELTRALSRNNAVEQERTEKTEK